MASVYIHNKIKHTAVACIFYRPYCTCIFSLFLLSGITAACMHEVIPSKGYWATREISSTLSGYLSKEAKDRMAIFTSTVDMYWHLYDTPDSKVHGTNMGPIRGRQDPGGPHVGPMNFVIWDINPCHVLFCIVNAVSAGDLATQGVQA